MSKPHFSILPSGPKVERKLQVAASSLPCGPLSTPLALAWRWESTPLGLRDYFWCLSAAGMWNINKALTLTHLRPLDGVRAILRRPVVMESPPVPGTEWGWQGGGWLRATPLCPAKGASAIHGQPVAFGRMGAS